jgi:hypothetical protein
MGQVEEPVISLTYISRNDRHGGDLLGRIQVAVDALVEYRDRFGLNSELNFVEWNPPTGKPYLYDTIECPGDYPLRWFVVPHEIHRQFKYWEQFGLWHQLGQNVGFRRARGDWLMNCSHDIVFSEEMAQWLANEDFSGSYFYRAVRVDSELDCQPGRTTHERVEEMKRRVVKTNKVRGPGLFTKASGDFILISRKSYHKIKGYVEWTTDGMYTDGLLLYCASAIGLRQAILKPVIYHVEHGKDRGSVTFVDRPHMKHNYYKSICAYIMRTGKPLDVNTDNWGLANCDVEQIRDNVWMLSGGSPPVELKKPEV